MHVLFATGIYPPEIGGPATYVQQLSGKLKERGHTVSIVTYGDPLEGDEEAHITRVSRAGGPLRRWWRYAQELRRLGAHTDVVYCFSSVSVGVPLMLSRLRGPKRVLRLGGDFGWERYTDKGGSERLSDWYALRPWVQRPMQMILSLFDFIVFSTQFQEELYERFYSALPLHSVIENALPAHNPVVHTAHAPFKLLFMGRFVSFKNIPSLLEALTLLPDTTLSIVGDGPLEKDLRAYATTLGVADRVSFHPPVSGQEKRTTFLSHDVLVLPSVTEISPNVALEARALGLPVLLTEETGLSIQLRQGMLIEQLRTPEQIIKAVRAVQGDYDRLAQRSAAILPERTWDDVADEHLSLFQGLL